MNENYRHPAMPEGAADGIVKGMYRLASTAKAREQKKRVQLLGSGTILHEVIEAAALLAQDFGISADVWSATSFNQLARDGHEVARWNLLQLDRAAAQGLRDPVPGGTGRSGRRSDRLHPDLRRSDPAFVPQRYVVLGTDGYGRATPARSCDALRGRPPLRGARGAEGAGRPGHDQSRQASRTRSRSTRSHPETPYLLYR